MSGGCWQAEEPLLDRILEISRDLFRLDNAIIRLLDPEKEQLVTAASFGYDPQVTRQPILLGEGIMGKAERIRRVLKTGQAENLRLLHRGRAGQNRLQKRKLTPLKEGDRTTGVVVVVEDVTEFEQLLAQTIESEKLAELGRMSAGIAHEINNPLAVISFANDILLDNDSNSAEQHELLKRVDSEVERLKGLTTELLSYSSTADQEKREPTDINTTLRETIELLRYELRKKQVQTELQLADLPLLSINRNKFKQIFINLILNAVQALDTAGTVEIRTALSASGLTIVFSDDGPGIPQELVEKIFEPFFTSRKNGGGTGLGLYLCRKIINSYQGELSVSNNPERGCSFVLSLPQNVIIGS